VLFYLPKSLEILAFFNISAIMIHVNEENDLGESKKLSLYLCSFNGGLGLAGPTTITTEYCKGG